MQADSGKVARDFQVPHWLKELDKSLGELDSAIGTIFDKVQSVSVQEPPANITGETLTPGDSLVSVARQLRDFKLHIDNIVAAVRAMYGRIEL